MDLLQLNNNYGYSMGLVRCNHSIVELVKKEWGVFFESDDEEIDEEFDTQDVDAFVEYFEWKYRNEGYELVRVFITEVNPEK